MSEFGLEDIEFELDYIDFERYRMYPPGYGKESTVTESDSPDKWFCLDFFEFERNRMYPPGYRKEPSVKTLKMRHITAITRAQNLLETAVNVGNNWKLRKSIEKDIQILAELRMLLYEAYENPTLPFQVEQRLEPVPVLNPIDDEPDEAP